MQTVDYSSSLDPSSSSSFTSTPDEESADETTALDASRGHGQPSLSRWELARQAWLAPGSGWELSGSKGLSHLLKEATAQAHKDVLRPPVVNKLITGRIALDVHILYLMMLYDVYEALETALSRHADHPLLAAIHNPSVLDRTAGISDDVTYLLDLPNGSDWSLHPTARKYRAHPPRALVEYVHRIKSLDLDSHLSPDDHTHVYPPPPAQPYLLLAHAYVRYMGDLNGGQQIKESVAKAYHLEEGSSDGLRFYRFENDNGEECSPAELGRVTAGFRKGMDSIGEGLNPGERAALLQEANHAFELNIRLFSSFSEAAEKKSTLAPPTAELPRIPSPSLEGYAKAATYMPSRGPSRRNSEEDLKSLAMSSKAKDKATWASFQWLIIPAVLLPCVYYARQYMQAYVS